MMGMVAVAMMLGGCAETDNDVMETAPAVKDGQTVKIKVVDNGYGDVTRAAESNEEEAQGENTIMQTNFIAGDKIGVFSISAGGAQHYRNLELRYDGTNWVNPDGETFYYFTGMRYFAYYPYNPDFDMSKVDWSQTTVDEFFAPYVAAWQPQADQSTTVKYMASDLMVGAGALSGETFTFSMGHTMGLVFVSVAEELNGTVYLFPKLTESEALTNFNANTTKLFTFEQKVYKPSQKQGYYRYIVKPGNPQFISGMNPDGRTFSFTCDNVSAGHYKKFVVDGGFDPSKSTIEDFTVQVGDILFNDMHIEHLPETPARLSNYSSTIGIISYLAELGDEYTEGYMHGLVLKSSAQEESSNFWEYYTTKTENPIIPNCVNVGQMLDDKSGLTNSQGVPGSFTLAQTSGYKSYNYLSKWFIPSSGQWIMMITAYGKRLTSAKTEARPYFSGTYSIGDGSNTNYVGSNTIYNVFKNVSSSDNYNPGKGKYYDDHYLYVSTEASENGEKCWMVTLLNGSFLSGNKWNGNGADGRRDFCCAF